MTTVTEVTTVTTYLVVGLADPPGSEDVTVIAAGDTRVAGLATVTIPTGDVVPMGQQAKVGAKCCGCCCDYRRALIIVAIIGFALSLYELTLAIAEDVDDYSIGVIILVAVLGLSASICAFVGAIKFKIWLVAVNVVWLSGKY